MPQNIPKFSHQKILHRIETKKSICNANQLLVSARHESRLKRIIEQPRIQQ